MNKEQTKEKIFQKALELLEEGRSKTAILDAYPEERAELLAFLETIENVKSESEIIPPEALLVSILDKASLLSVKSPYQNIGRYVSGLSYFKKFSFASIVAVLLILGGFAFNHRAGPASQMTQSPASDKQQFNSSGTNQQGSGISSIDASDASLDQDLNEIDEELEGLDSDNSNVDEALGTDNS